MRVGPGSETVKKSIGYFPTFGSGRYLPESKPSHTSAGTTGRNTKSQTPCSKHQTPNTKHQTPEKFQITSFKAATSRAELGFGAWDFFGVWSLVFGVWISGFGVS